jgi:hypothetical protein
MFSERIFSIGISKFKLNGLDNETLCEQVKLCQNGEDEKFRRDMGLDNYSLKQLNSIVIEQSQKILDGIANSDLKIKTTLKRVWGNHNLNSDICIPHAHRDSFLSAVYYPKSIDGRIHFYCPWADGILSHIPIETAKEFNEYNSSYYELQVETGWLILFPAHLCHFVPVSKEERFSIVYDIGVEL